MGGASGGGVYVGWNAAVEAEGMLWGPRLTYERVGIGRFCEDSLPPQCSIDVAGGRLILLGVSRQLTSRSGVRLLLRPEAGAAIWTNNSEDGTFAEFAVGAGAEVRVSVGTGACSIGGSVRRSRAATVAGVSAGLGIRF